MDEAHPGMQSNFVTVTNPSRLLSGKKARLLPCDAFVAIIGLPMARPRHKATP
jgi:hypothetical protein